MPALNRVQLIGCLGRDTETRVTPTGKKVSQLSLAVCWRGSDEPDRFRIEVRAKEPVPA